MFSGTWKVCIQKLLGIYSYSKHALEVQYGDGREYKTLFLWINSPLM